MEHSGVKKVLHRATGGTVGCSSDDRNITEQLRYNHIETLEVLTRTQLENDELKKLVESLKKKILAMGGSWDDDENRESENVEHHSLSKNTSTANLTVDLAKLTDKQAKEITLLKEQLRKLTLEERKKFTEMQTKQQQEFSQQIMKLAQREKELQLQVKALEDALSLSNGDTNQQVRSLQHQVLDLTEHVQLKENEIITLKLSQEITKNELLQCEQSKKELSQLLQHELEQKNLQIDHLNRLLHQDGNSHESQLGEYQALIVTLQQDVHMLKQRNEELTNQCEVLNAEKSALILETVSASASGKSAKKEIIAPGIRSIVITSKSEPSLTMTPSQPVQMEQPPSELPLQQQQQQQQQLFPVQDYSLMGDDEDDSSIVTGGGGFRFQEYVRLKRENKELKMQLADITCGKHQVARRSFDSSLPSGASTSSTLARTPRPKNAVKFPKVSNTGRLSR